jgi:hypothetical protein
LCSFLSFSTFLRIEIPCGISLYCFSSKNFMKNYLGTILQAISKALEFYTKSKFLQVIYLS